MRIFTHIPTVRCCKSFYFAVFSWMIFASVGIIGLFNIHQPGGETCIFDDRFGRWECCDRIIRQNGRTLCAPNQSVRVLNTPKTDLSLN